VTPHPNTPRKKERKNTMNATQALLQAIAIAESLATPSPILPTPAQIKMWQDALDQITAAPTPTTLKTKAPKTTKAVDYPNILSKIKPVAVLPDLYADGERLTRYTEDLDTISIPSTLPPGAYRLINKCLIRIGETPAPDMLPPVPALTGDITAINIASFDLRAALMAVQAAQSVDPTRYALNGIFVQADQNGLSTTATDSRRLHTFTAQSGTASSKTEFVIPTAAVATLIKLLPPDPTPVTLNQANDNLRIKCGDAWQASLKMIAGQYPNYRQVIPASAESPIRINTAEWLTACQAILALETQRLKTSGADRLYPTTYLEVKNSQLFLSSRKYHPKEDVIPEQEFCLGSSPAIPNAALNVEFLIDIMRQCGDEAWLHPTQQNAPLLITAGYFLGIIMPLRVE
jgi:DNA polymerase III sliding clamp (beta) subunit (PCNA family)